MIMGIEMGAWKVMYIEEWYPYVKLTGKGPLGTYL